MKGTFGRLLTIDLTGRTAQSEEIPDRVLEEHLGGKGLGAYLLKRLNPPGVDPLSADNHLILNTGPACGFPVWGANRFAAFTKSPLTGIFAESYSGGRAFQPMSGVGYDAFVLQGRLERWGYLEITPGGVGYHDATELIGKDALETERLLRERYPGRDTAVLTIGPAGEKLVRFAYVNNDHGRCLGRTGIGAVLGSKRVKALVFRGGVSKEAADPELLERFRKEIGKIGRGHPVTEAYHTKGTSMMVDLTSKVEAFPSRYWQEGRVAHQGSINAEALHSQCSVKPGACTYCFIGCTRNTEVTSGRHEGLRVDGPEYETIYVFGGLNLVTDIREIAYLNDVCDRLGMDSMTAGNITAFAIEAYKRGRIDFAIDYGQVDRIAELLGLIAARDGVGDLLAEGVRAAARRLELEEISIQVKGLEPAGYDPRYLQGMGLGYAVSDRGACHLRSTFYKPELAGMIDPQDNAGKAAMLLEYEDRLTIFDCLILCRFFRDFYYWKELGTILEGTLGLRLEEGELKTVAARIARLTREFNLQEGMRPEDDGLPEYFFAHPVGSGSFKLDHDRFGALLQEYHRLRGI
ncbi:MAG: aldehyde ferredoxin oxidoreductase family protein [Spirochaetales bacterium]|nr:aldehyde ferredoxin oxidoreductase family protein [Spirochaetales bacterium]